MSDLYEWSAGLRIAVLIDQWEQSGKWGYKRCASDLRSALVADDILGAFVQTLSDNSEELDKLRTLLRTVETIDFGGYTQRDADAVAVALWSAGYRLTREGDGE